MARRTSTGRGGSTNVMRRARTRAFGQIAGLAKRGGARGVIKRHIAKERAPYKNRGWNW